ncbi:hypothetical protein RchiOBHm_Chr4g0397441 [Rosa chinensis]|uniref:Uncharacterized protein n=1 Tax=Rosa chinensis TaxID=74649 RepID=A0A2P6QS27_ROSCH|nr:hypothetical protein RchiOBHm_Chr4g0397441 [Rosa chinensis]
MLCKQLVWLCVDLMLLINWVLKLLDAWALPGHPLMDKINFCSTLVLNHSPLTRSLDPATPR